MICKICEDNSARYVDQNDDFICKPCMNRLIRLKFNSDKDFTEIDNIIADLGWDKDGK